MRAAAAPEQAFTELEHAPLPERDLVTELRLKLHTRHAAAGFPAGADYATDHELAKLLTQALDPRRTAEAIEANHGKAIRAWQAERQRNPRAFVPQISRWLRDGDWAHPPDVTAIPAARPTKAEAIAAVMERARKVVPL